MTIDISILLLVCVILAAGLVCYALYLGHKSMGSRARFATIVIASNVMIVPTTIFAINNLQIIDYIFAGVDWARTGIWQSPPSSSGLLRIIDYAFIIATAVFVIRSVNTFASGALSKWEGDLTKVDAILTSEGKPLTSTALFLKLAELSLRGEANSLVDPRALDLAPRIATSPTPPEWQAFSRELLLQAMNEVSIGEDPDGWSDDLGCWIGTFSPRWDRGTSRQICLFPLERDERGAVDDCLHRLIARSLPPETKVFVAIRDAARTSEKRNLSGYEVLIYDKETLLDMGLNLRPYCEELIRRFYQEPILGTPHSLESMFVPGLAYPRDNPIAPVDVMALLEEWAGTDTNEQLSIVGEFGQGKSTAVLAYCARWAKRYLNGQAETERVPLLVTLRGRDPSSLSPEDLLAAWGTKFRLPGRALLNLVTAGRGILFFEGFDEVSNAGLRSQRYRQLNALWKLSFPGSKIVLTGRQNFFLDDDELLRLLNIDEANRNAGRSYSRCYTLHFFDRDRIERALDAFDPDVRSEILAHYDRDDSFREVASRPSMLPLIAVIWPELRQSLRDKGTITTYSVISKYINFEYRRKMRDVDLDESVHGLPREHNYLQIPLSIKEFYMTCAARAMALSMKSNTILWDDLQSCFRRAMRVSESHIKESSNDEEEIAHIAKLRLAIEEHGEADTIERLASELRTTGMLVRDVASGPNSFYFPHKQFYEYYIAEFCATAVKKKIERQVSAETSKFFSTDRPCTPLLRDAQAREFFVQRAEAKWFLHVFTVPHANLGQLLSLILVFPYVSLLLPSRLSVVDSTADENATPQGSGFVSLGRRLLTALGYTILLLMASVAVYLVVEFTLITAICVAIVGAMILVGVKTGASGTQVSDVLLWYRMLRRRYPEDYIRRAAGIIGLPAARALHLLYQRRFGNLFYYRVQEERAVFETFSEASDDRED
jgi:hypothetical protein